MNTENIEDKYKTNVKKYTDTTEKLKKKIKWLVFVRLLLFSLFIYFFIISIKNNFNYLLIFFSILSFISFIVVVKHSISSSRLIRYYLNLILINSNEIKALHHDFSCFEGGEDFSIPSHPFSYDLDFFGKESVFSQINRTVSENGKVNLASWFCNPLTDKVTIIERQEAVKELSDRLNIRQNFIALGKEKNEINDQREQILNWADQMLPESRIRYMKTIAIIFSSVSFITILLTIAGIISYLLLFMVLLINGIFIFSQMKTINKEHAQVSHQYENIMLYAEQIKLIETSDFKTKLLILAKNKISGKDQSGSKAIKHLALIINAFDYRLNLLVSIVLTGFFFWDFFCMIRLYNWKLKHNKILKQWFEVLDDFDALQSISNFYYNNPAFVFATFNSDAKIFTGYRLGHPQIEPSKRIVNNLDIEKKGTFLIITGPNMAGKSTFLRTIGISIVLAQSGAPVCASKINIQPVILYSSMRTSDSLYKNESYFFAELKRLKEIIKASTEHDNIFIILDEILKGTNSKDKAEGSKGFMKKITSLGATGLVATHDLSLGNLKKEIPGNITNYCFEAETQGDGLIYNYLLKKGLTTKMNASVLMKQMGII